MRTHTLSFKSPAGEQQYLAAYATNLALWPIQPESHYIKTSHGITHVLICGPADAPPVVLLHAYGFSATEWYANIGALAADHRVYAVDVMGDMTQTVMSRPFKKRAETALWLGELLDELGISRAIMIGHSYGGWLTLNFALHAPERLERIVLLAPASSFVPMVGKFNWMRISAYLFPKWGLPRFANWCVAPGNAVPQGLVDLMGLGMKHYRFTAMVVQPDVYTDEELRQIKTPALLVVGEHEVIYNPTKAVARAKALLPNLQVQMIAGASHALVMEQPERVNGAIRSFITAR